MAANLSPPICRLRASSTNAPPPTAERDVPSLTLAIPKPIDTSAPDSMLSVLLAKCVQLFHSSHQEQSLTPSSPRLSRSSTSTEDSVLPLSSPTSTSFGDVLSEKTSASPRAWWKGTPSMHAPVLFVIISFPLSAALVLFCISTLPITMSWPRNLTDLAQLGRELHGYSQSGPGPMAHVIGVMSVTAVWKHAWSIPGSVIWNVLAGALFSPAYATLLLTLLTTIGSILASILSAPLAPILSSVFPRALAMTRNALEGESEIDAAADEKKSKSPAWVRLSVLRLIGIIPWSGINIACGVCGVSITDCFFGAFIGSLPWTAVTCQIGDILQTVASNPSPTPRTVQSLLASPEIIFKLAFLSFLSLAPILGRDYLRMWISSPLTSRASVLGSDDTETSDDERASRWAWVKEWRGRIHVPSRSRTRERLQRELEVLVREKNETLPM
ncbi:Golgi apparatus membrane protein TVP38 [Abortiporus biennis]